MGTPEFSVPVLKYLKENTSVLLVVTQPDKIVGKSKVPSYSPVKAFALENRIEVFQPQKIRDNFEIISELNPDLIVTCAYGQIIPQKILDIPKYGCINVHASLLPYYRGASPIQSAILNGEKETGITIMYMDKGMDTGDIISQVKVDILPDDNNETLHDKLANAGVKLLDETLPLIISGENKRIKQDNNIATYTRLLTREDEKIDFHKNGEEIINQIRAFAPNPMAYFVLNNQEIKVLEACFIPKEVEKAGKVIFEKKAMYITCADGLISLEIIKPMGKKQMPIVAYLNGIKKENDLYVC